MTANYDRLLQTAHEAVDEAKKIFLKPAEHQITAKGDRDYATEADYEIERVVRSMLAKATPDIGFLGEEEGHIGNTERYWCLDPIDGTVNYAHGSPLCGISLAFIEGEEPAVGVIDLPLLQCRYWASKGGGAFRDAEPIVGGRVTELGDAIASFGDFAVGDDAMAHNGLPMRLFDLLAAKALRVRMLGSAAVDLAWVADGKTDIAVIVGGQLWDVGAGMIIAREAGLDIHQSEIDGQLVIIASTEPLRKSLASGLSVVVHSDSPTACPVCGVGADQSSDPENMSRSVCYCGHPRFYDYKIQIDVDRPPNKL